MWDRLIERDLGRDQKCSRMRKDGQPGRAIQMNFTVFMETQKPRCKKKNRKLKEKRETNLSVKRKLSLCVDVGSHLGGFG